MKKILTLITVATCPFFMPFANANSERSQMEANMNKFSLETKANIETANKINEMEEEELNVLIQLGDFHSHQTNKNPDYTKAFECYRKAADKGSARAQSKLSVMYGGGFGCERNQVEEIRWCQKAAIRGEVDAQVRLGVIYSCAKYYAEAAHWYKKAAEQGDINAARNLGDAYCNMSPPNYGEAIKWAQKAADTGDLKSQFNLGGMYANGRGVPRNFTEAYARHSVALLIAEQKLSQTEISSFEKAMIEVDIMTANMLRDELRQLLTQSQIAEATQRARIIFEKFPKKTNKSQ